MSLLRSRYRKSSRDKRKGRHARARDMAPSSRFNSSLSSQKTQGQEKVVARRPKKFFSYLSIYNIYVDTPLEASAEFLLFKNKINKKEEEDSNQKNDFFHFFFDDLMYYYYYFSFLNIFLFSSLLVCFRLFTAEAGTPVAEELENIKAQRRERELKCVDSVLPDPRDSFHSVYP